MAASTGAKEHGMRGGGEYLGVLVKSVRIDLQGQVGHSQHCAAKGVTLAARTQKADAREEWSVAVRSMRGLQRHAKKR
eukprot:2602387-Rhodomonas_salina.1